MSDKDRANQAIQNDDGEDRDANLPTRITMAFTSKKPELFHDPDKTGYATVKLEGVNQTLRILSANFKRLLRAIWFDAIGEGTSSNAINDATALLDAMAIFKGKTRKVATRLLEKDGFVWLDLANERGEVVEIRHDGWYVRPCPDDIKFERPAGMLPLPNPTRNGKFSDLRSLINVTEESWSLVAGWLLGTLHPDGPYPILFLNGPQGSAKSTTTRLLRSLVDPNSVSVATLKSDERDLAIAAQHEHILCFDNVSGISDRVSDILCRISTGGGFRTRSLYTNDDESLFDFKRPMIINGIGDLATRPDLLERALAIQCPGIPSHSKRRERDVFEEFNLVQAKVLGAMLDAACLALAGQDSIPVTEAVRMADFLAFVEAGESALGLEPGTIRAAYIANQGEANVIALEESPVAAAIRSGAFPDFWEGTASDLIDKLFPDTTRQERSRRGLPVSPVSMSNALKRVEPNLATAGVAVERTKSGKSRNIRISKQVVTVVTSSSSSSTGNDDSDDYDDLYSNHDIASTDRIQETFDD